PISAVTFLEQARHGQQTILAHFARPVAGGVRWGVATGGRRSYDWRPWAGASERSPSYEPAVSGAVEAGGPNRRARQVRSSALSGLLVLTCVYTLAVARPFLVPLAIGLILYFLLRPPVRTLKSLRVPEPLGAALVLAALLAFVGIGFYALSWPATTWAARAPES